MINDDLLSISQVDKEGTQITMDIPYSFFITCAFLKILFGLAVYCQGKWIRNIFKPLLKEYVDAENGITNGVPMDKRRSKDMLRLKCKLRKNTCFCGVLTLICLYIGYHQSVAMVDSYLDQKYDFYAANNMTNFTDSFPFYVPKQ